MYKFLIYFGRSLNSIPKIIKLWMNLQNFSFRWVKMLLLNR